MNRRKTIVYLSVIFLVVGVVSSIQLYIESSSTKYKQLLERYLVQEASSNFENMIVAQAWNASHGGVFVKQHEGIKPNPYLKNNVLMTDKNETLIKINPAWMTRQMSEISNNANRDYYKVTSLNPINPSNKADAFEIEALQYLEKNRSKKYYYQIKELENLKVNFDFLGKLDVTQKCMLCHADQGYKVGDIKGGIRVSVPTKKYTDLLKHHTANKVFMYRTIFIITFLVLLVIGWLIHRNYVYQEKIEKEKETFQSLINLQLNIVIVTNGEKLVYANKSFFNFFDYSHLESFLEEHDCICERFEVDNDYFHLEKIDENENWVYYLYAADSSQRFVKMLDTKGNVHIFSVYINKFRENLFLVTFSDVSNKMKEYLELEKDVLLEKMMIAESRAEAMSDIIQMLSHQWRQPLSSLGMSTANLLIDLELGDYSKESLIVSAQEMDEKITELASVIEKFNNIFSQNASLESNVDIVKLIESVILLKAKEFESHHITAKIISQIPLVWDTHSKDLFNIILVIFNNAQEAILKNKVLNGFINIEIENKDKFVCIHIEDNGNGVDENIINNIFEPYFTTKELYNEAGLSLFTAKIMLERLCNASISVKNGKFGARFTITMSNEKNKDVP
ncbi:MAG: signal transduction histidine kinase [Sulfurimonas sp.]|jgi:signal transduction histidine kinase|uniref:c-type heme family protein n=1 Tax=Sulfurimonas sp. TaxID=2022749 RepID=UPI0039E45876